MFYILDFFLLIYVVDENKPMTLSWTMTIRCSKIIYSFIILFNLMEFGNNIIIYNIKKM